MGNLAKNNSYKDPYKQQLTSQTLDLVIDGVHQPSSFEKRVYLSKMCRRYGTQLNERLKQRTALVANMAEAKRWEKDTLIKIQQRATPVPGYDFDERTGSLVTTANLQSFKLDTESTFSGTLETTDKLKKSLGYATGAIIVGFVLYGGYLLRQVIKDTEIKFGEHTTILC